jgi:hypothetical protein
MQGSGKVATHHIWATACVLALLSAPASAATAVSWDLESPNGVNSGGTNHGNVRTFTSGSHTLTVKAYGSTASSGGSDANGALQTAYVSQFDGGLGVCNQVEDPSGSAICPSAPNHATDNEGRDDFLLFDFGSIHKLSSLSIGWYDTDADIQVWIGTGSADINLAGKCVMTTGSACTQTLADLGFVAQALKSNVQNTGTATFGDSTPAGRYVLVSGASGLLNSGNAGNDHFKLSALTAYVPVPGTLALFGVGFLGLVGTRRSILGRFAVR